MSIAQDGAPYRGRTGLTRLEVWDPAARPTAQNCDLHHFPCNWEGHRRTLRFQLVHRKVCNPFALVMVITQKECLLAVRGIIIRQRLAVELSLRGGTVAIRNGVGPICRGDEMVAGVGVPPTYNGVWARPVQSLCYPR